MNRQYRKIVRLIALLLADSLFFTLIDPTKAYAIVDIIGLLMLIVTIYVGIDLLLVLMERLINLSLRSRKRVLNASTSLLALLIAMQSIGQLTVRDMLAIVPLILVLAFYFSYQTKENRP